MTLEVDYIPFATGGGANVYTPATYQALSVVPTGVEPGLSDPQLANTTWRLASMVTAAIANFISQSLQINVLDDGNLTNLIANFTGAVQLSSQTKPSRIVTASTTLTMTTADYAVGLLRTVGVAAMVANLPSGPAVGYECKILDLEGNFQASPVTATPQAGYNIAGAATLPLNVNRRGAVFNYMGSSTWGVGYGD